MTTGHTAQGPTPTSVVIFVYELDPSAAFYTELLHVETTVRTDTAALLARADGLQLYLRATGRRGEHTAGDVGVQYVIWTAADAEDLDRCEQFLKSGAAHTSTWRTEGFCVVEGRDPSGTPVLISYPGPRSVPRHDIMNRIYAW